MRHAPFLISQLGLINGNVDQYIDGMTKGSDVNEDFNKGMQAFSNQLKLLQNNFKSLNIFASEFADTIGVDMIKGMNRAIEGIQEMTDDSTNLGMALSSVSDAVITLSIVMAGLSVAKFGLGRLVGGLSSIAGLLGGGVQGALILAGIVLITGALITAYSWHKRIVMKRQEELELQEAIIKKTEAQIKANDALYRAIEVQRDLLVKIANEDLTKNWDRAYDIISAVTDKSSELKNILEATEKIKAFKLPELTSYNEAFKEALELAQEERKNMEKNALENDKNYKKRISNLRLEQNELENTLRYGDKRIQNQKEYAKAIEEFSKSARSPQRFDLTDETQFKQAETAFREFRKRMNLSEVGEYSDTGIRKLLKENRELQVQAKKETYKDLIKEDEDYAKTVTKLELSNRKVDKEFYDMAIVNLKEYYDEKKALAKDPSAIKSIEDQYKIQQSLLDKFVEDNKDKEMLNVLGDLDKSTLSAIYGTLSKETRELLVYMDFVGVTQKIQLDNATLINQKAMELTSYYEQMSSTLSGMEYQAFSDMLEKTSVKGLEQYKHLAETMGFTEVSDGIDMMTEKLSKIEVTKLIDDGNLLNAIGQTKGIEEAIQNLKDSLKDGDVTKALDKLKKENKTIFDNADSAYEGLKGNTEEYVDFMIKKLKEILDVQLQAMLAVDPNQIKSAFYSDESHKQSLELLKVQKEGVDLLLVEQDILKENSKIREKDLEYRFKALNKLYPEQKKLRDMTLEQLKEEKQSLIGKKVAQQKGGINLITVSDVKNAEYIDELIKLILEDQEGINSEKIAEIELNNKIMKQIEKVSEDTEKVIKSFDKLNKNKRTFAELTRIVSGNTKDDLVQQGNRIKNDLIEKNTLLEKAKLYATSKEDVLLLSEVIKTNSELAKEDLDDILEKIKQAEELEKRQQKINDTLKKSGEIRKKISNMSLHEYDLAKKNSENIDKSIKEKTREIEISRDMEQSAQLQNELAELQLKKEMSITDEIAKRNNIINQAITGTGQIINLLSGASGSMKSLGDTFSAIAPMMGGVFNKDAQGRNVFQSTMAGFGAFKAGGTDDISKFAGMGMMLGGAGAIASMAMPIADAVFGTADKDNARADARFKKQMDISIKQLEALENMSGALEDYSDKFIGALVSMPTFQKLAEQKMSIETVVTSVKGQGLDLSDVVFKRKAGKDWRGKTKYKTKKEDVNRIIQNIMGDTDLDYRNMSLDTMKALETQMSSVDDWNAWYKKNMGSAGRVMSTNIKVIQDQLSEYIKAYEETNRMMEDLMKEATFGAMKGIDYTSPQKAREDFKSLGESLKLQGEELNKFVEKQMSNFKEITTTAGIAIRTAIVDGVEQGLSETEMLVNGFRSIFDEVGSNINSIMSDIKFGELYSDIEDATVNLANHLRIIKEKVKDTDVTDSFILQNIKGEEERYIKTMIESLSEAQELDSILIDFNSNMREAMVLSGEFSQEFIDKMYPVKEVLSETQEEFKSLTDEFRDAIANALKTDDLDTAMSDMGSFLSDKMINSFIDNTLSSKYKEKIAMLSTSLFDAMNFGVSISGVQSIQTDVNKAMLDFQGLQNKALAIKDILNIGMGDMEYESINRSVQYETGSTQTINNNYYYNATAQIGNMIADDASMHLLALRLKEYLANV